MTINRYLHATFSYKHARANSCSTEIKLKKITHALFPQMKAVGVSVDFAYCAGHNRKGERCQNVVNKSTCPFCDHHLQQGRKKLVMGARPECQGTVLGAVHGAQMKNPECLTKLSQRTPKRKRPQSLGTEHLVVL